jgi:segregation and condensation protein A
MEDKIFNVLVEQQEISWRAIIFDLIKAEGMDPWDLDLSSLTQRYIQKVREMKEHDLQVSGKVLLAAAMLLKIKSNRLVGEDINEFDRLLASGEMSEDEFYAELEEDLKYARVAPPEEMLKLIPRTPQPRKRKVSVYDLVRALEKALEVKHRRLVKVSSPEGRTLVPKKRVDINLAIKQVYKKIRTWFVGNRKPRVNFSELMSEHPTKDEKLETFLPLLHLATQRKIDINQETHFGDISVRLRPDQKKPEAQG